MDPVGIAVDGTGGHIYWARHTFGDDRIVRSDLSGADVQTLIDWPTVSNPIGLALDIPDGRLYWAEQAAGDDAIRRANLDGSGAGTVVAWPAISNPVGLALDIKHAKVNWTQLSPGEDRIARAHLGGSRVETLVAWPVVTNPSAVALEVSLQPCGADVECDDDLFCTGTETCTGGFCRGGTSPCTSGEVCDEGGAGCIPCGRPSITATGARYLRITPAPGSDPLAIRMEGDGSDPAIACVSLYVQAPEQHCIGGALHRDLCTTDADCPDPGTCQASAALGTDFVRLTPR